MSGKIEEFLAEHRIDFEMWLSNESDELELYTREDLDDMFNEQLEEARANLDVDDSEEPEDHEKAIEFSEWLESEGFHDLCSWVYGIDYDYSSRFDSVAALVDEYLSQHLEVD